MADTGWVICGTGADDASAGTVAWSNPGNITTDDSSNATCVENGSASHWLKATNFGFSVPAGATIDGVEVNHRGTFTDSYSQDPAQSMNIEVRLVKGGTIQGDTKIPTNPGPTERDNLTGANNVLWGLTLSQSDVNASDFGVVVKFQCTDGGGGGDSAIDYVAIKVTYTAAAVTTGPAQLMTTMKIG